MNENRYESAVPFLDESDSFAHGFEAGLIWSALDDNNLEDAVYVHTANCNQLRLIAEHFGYDIVVYPSDNEGFSYIEVYSPPSPALTLIKNEH